MKLKEITSEKGRSLLICEENYTYREMKQLKSTGETFWYCTKKNCRAKIYTIQSERIFTRKIGNHDHSACDEKVINRRTISNSIKRKAVESIVSERPLKLLHQELISMPGVASTLTNRDKKYICNNISYLKQSFTPNLPKNMDETHDYLDSIEIVTLQKENFLLINDKSLNLIVFSTEKK